MRIFGRIFDLWSMRFEQTGNNIKILRKIIGPRNTSNGWRQRKNAAMYLEINRLSNAIKNHRLTFYGHFLRMDSDRSMKKISAKCQDLKTTSKWFVCTGERRPT